MRGALIIVDVQNDFCEGGSLEVKNANEIIPLINNLINDCSDKFILTILTKDWHPEEHISFIGNNLESKLINPSEITLKWKSAFPKHCVQGSIGAEIHSDLIKKDEFIFITKGYEQLEESFSGFFNPELNNILKKNNIDTILVVGLAYDFCVANTAYDSAKLGYKTYILKEACREISESTSKEAEENFDKLGINLIEFKQLNNIFS